MPNPIARAEAILYVEKDRVANGDQVSWTGEWAKRRRDRKVSAGVPKGV